MRKEIFLEEFILLKENDQDWMEKVTIHKVFITNNKKLWPYVDHRELKVDFFPTGHVFVSTKK